MAVSGPNAGAVNGGQAELRAVPAPAFAAVLSPAPDPPPPAPPAPAPSPAFAAVPSPLLTFPAVVPLAVPSPPRLAGLIGSVGQVAPSFSDKLGKSSGPVSGAACLRPW